MNKLTLVSLTELRLLIGYLGEKAQNEWWPSSFLTPASEAFLRPVFPRTFWLAQYRGVYEAALRVHDEHIGLGRHYHLYRLPDAWEQAMARIVPEPAFSRRIQPALASPEAALTRLSEQATPATEQAEGPILAGLFSADGLDRLMSPCAGHYLRAFTDGYRCFPYLKAA